jgi:Na+/phosphate symporter
MIDQFLISFLQHAIGFGFYIALTTRKTRWLGAIIVGGVLFFISLWLTSMIPRHLLDRSHFNFFIVVLL